MNRQRGFLQFAGVPTWALYALAAAAIAATGFGAGWAVNGWRLGSEIAEQRTTITALQAQVSICGEVLQRQNDATEAIGKLGAQITGGLRNTLAAIEKNAVRDRAQMGVLQGLLSKPTPIRLDGSKSDCRDAWREIEKEAKR